MPLGPATVYLAASLDLLTRSVCRLFWVARNYQCEALTTTALQWVVRCKKMMRAVTDSSNYVEMPCAYAQQDFIDAPISLLGLATVCAFDAIKEAQVAFAAAAAAGAVDEHTRRLAVRLSIEFCMAFPPLLQDDKFHFKGRVEAHENDEAARPRCDKARPTTSVPFSNETWVALFGEEMGKAVLIHFLAADKKIPLPSERAFR